MLHRSKYVPQKKLETSEIDETDEIYGVYIGQKPRTDRGNGDESLNYFTIITRMRSKNL